MLSNNSQVLVQMWQVMQQVRTALKLSPQN
jgi:hypothetical protein